MTELAQAKQLLEAEQKAKWMLEAKERSLEKSLEETEQSLNEYIQKWTQLNASHKALQQDFHQLSVNHDSEVRSKGIFTEAEG